jgi:HEAT repeat protein
MTEANVAAPPVAAAGSSPAAPADLTATVVVPPVSVPPSSQATQPDAVDADSGNSSLFTYSIVAGTMVCGLMGLVVMRRRRRTDELQEIEEFLDGDQKQSAASGEAKAASRKSSSSKTKDKDKGKDKSKTALQPIAQAHSPEVHGLTNGDQSLAVRAPRPSLAPPTMIFGAYQIEQEIEKLVLGQAHRLDVVCSRALDDRRAIETSLMKVLQNTEATDGARRKARQALEDYGFVARACASLLLSPEVFDRLGAARTLSSIRSAAALPFMIEALYDRESIVRTEAVNGLGELRLPAAIGALLDVARRHSDISPALLSGALTACSVESLNFGSYDSTAAAAAGVASNSSMNDGAWTGEIMKLEPVETIMELPQWLEDDTLAEALARLDDSDMEARAAAARQLGQFPVQSSVESLAHLASKDTEVAVRAAAVTSLGALDHESVFAHILMRLIDEAREVRAAAARALSRLSFDRADAYVRVIETADAETLAAVAAALTGAGMAAQAIDRLISDDRRQAYEAFSLLSLLVKSGEVEALLTGIAEHRDLGVRLALVRFLGLTGGALYIERLKEVGGRDGMMQEVRDAITEAESKLMQAEIY